MLIGKINNKEINKNIIINSKHKRLNIDKIIKIGLLSTLVGYKRGKSIHISDKFKTKLTNLADFINFLLNHEGFAPINYKIKIFSNDIYEKVKCKHNKKSIIVLASGGIDSTAAILYYLNRRIKPILVSLDFGQINNKREQVIVKKIAKKLKLDLIIFKIDISKEVIKGWKDWSYIVPARNFLIACLGACTMNNLGYKGEIILAATQEEIHHHNPGPDKSPRFYDFCSRFFSREYNTNMKLKSPFDKKTKTEILSKWRYLWINKFGITPYETSTCYEGTECGKCNSCFKRSLALLSAGFNLDKKIKVNPFEYNPKKTYDYFNRIESKRSGFTFERKLDTLIAYIRAEKLDLLPQQISNELNPLRLKYKKNLANRIKRLNIKL